MTVKLEEEDHIEKPIELENHDESINMDQDENIDPILPAENAGNNNQENGKQKRFPFRLHDLASDENFKALSWNRHGTMLVVHMKYIKELAKICRSRNFSSFLRQLHLYGFRKNSRYGPNRRFPAQSAYYGHENFLRDHPEELFLINRVKI